MVCEFCGTKIEPGEEYLKFDGGIYHEDCFRDNTYEILEENGAKILHCTCGEEEPDYDLEIEERLFALCS